MLTAVAVLSLVVASLAALLIYGEQQLVADDNQAVDRIERLLPRIQCGQCGYPGCRPYAVALVDNDAAINLCPPGGAATVRALAEALGRDPEPLRTDLGRADLDSVAVVEETLCIGCGFCRAACPVDAIIGIFQTMHTVIEDYCTGCERCVAPCPVDCISMRPRNV